MLSPKQEEFILKSTATYNLAHGAVRAGKTFASLIRWAIHCKKCPDSDLVMIGHTAETIYENAIKPFCSLFDPYCVWEPGNYRLRYLDKTIRCIGASDQAAVGKIQGVTLSGAYIDEMTLLPQNFIDMLLTRLSKPHSKLFATMNPDSPLHEVKTRLIDKADGKDIYALHFELDDNPDLSQEYKDRIRRLYSGLWYKRYILGDWCMAEGAIYDFFDRNIHVIPRAPHAAKYYIVGIDYGTTNPFAMVVLGYNSDMGYTPSLWVEKEYYWNPKVTGRQKTDDEFADDIERELYGLPVRLVYVDPSAQSLEVVLRKRRISVVQADNDVLNGIRTVGNFIGQGDLKICSDAANLIKEMEGYVWDTKKLKLGEDAPLKQNDHACDALRYAIYSHFGKRLTLKKESPIVAAQKEKERLYKQDPMRYPGFTDSHGWQQFGGGNPGKPSLGGGPFGSNGRR
jgi:PBSX family phage terminase large subunit